MATRFYFPASGSPVVSPNFDAGWEQTGQATHLPLVRKSTLSAITTLANSSDITIPITTTQQILCYQFVSDEVFKPVRITAQDLFSLVIRCSENANSNNARIAYVLRAISQDGTTVLGTLASSMANVGTEFALHASSATRIFGDGATTVALTETTISEPWRLVLDLGSHAQAPTAAGNFRLRVGTSASTDFALTTALTTDLNPWMELSLNLDATRFNNYQHVSCNSSGISVTERIR